jgi:uracil-DNA glycosylase
MLWDELDFWQSEAWGEINDALDRLDKSAIHYTPRRIDIFKALHLTPFDSVKVVIVLPEPYSSNEYATGVAGSIPKTCHHWPATLVNLIWEYVDDLGNNIHGDYIGYPTPQVGSLEAWAQRGVLLLNSCPTFRKAHTSDGFSYNDHYGWKWNLLTEEILHKLSSRPQGTVFVFLGAKAREFINCVDDKVNFIIEAGHPSPQRRTRKLNHRPFNAFHGIRLFTTINDRLAYLKQSPIDWRL